MNIDIALSIDEIMKPDDIIIIAKHHWDAPVKLDENEKFEFYIQDDLSGLSQFYFQIEGKLV